MSFAELLSALPDSFSERHWTKAPCIVRGGGAALSGIVTSAEFDEYEADYVAAPTAWRPGGLARLGAGRYLAQAQLLNQRTAALLSEVRSTLGWERSDLVVIRNHAAGCSGAHFDHDENFFVQLEGAKRWKVWAPEQICDADKRLRTLGGPNSSKLAPTSNDSLTCSTVTVEAGDVLYLPAFWGHEVSALGPGLSLSISVQRLLADQVAIAESSARRLAPDRPFRLAPAPALPFPTPPQNDPPSEAAPSQPCSEVATAHERAMGRFQAAARAARPSLMDWTSACGDGANLSDLAGATVGRRVLSLLALGPADTWDDDLAAQWSTTREKLTGELEAAQPQRLLAREVLRLVERITLSCEAFDRTRSLAGFVELLAQLEAPETSVGLQVREDVSLRFVGSDAAFALVRRVVDCVAAALHETPELVVASAPEIVLHNGPLLYARAVADRRVAVIPVGSDERMAAELLSEVYRLRFQLVQLVGELTPAGKPDLTHEFDRALAALAWERIEDGCAPEISLPAADELTALGELVARGLHRAANGTPIYQTTGGGD